MQPREFKVVREIGEKQRDPAEGEILSDEDIERQVESSGMKNLSSEKDRQPIVAREEGDSIEPGSESDELSDDQDRNPSRKAA